MAVSKTTVTGPIYLPNCEKPEEARIVFELSGWDREEGEAVFVSGPYVGNLDENGDFSTELFTTTEGSNTVSYNASVIYVSKSGEHKREYIGSFSLAGTGPFKLADLEIVNVMSNNNSFDFYNDIAASKAVVAADRTAIQDAIAGIDSLGYNNLSSANIAANGVLSVGTIIGVLGHTTPGDGGGFEGVVQGSVSALNPGGGRIRPVSNTLLPEMFGAVGDGVADDTAALQATVDYCVAFGGKMLLRPQAHYRVSDTITISEPIQFDGQMAQVYQETADTDLFIFDKGASGAANYQNTFDIRNIVAATESGAGNCFTFRNINESTIENLFVRGCGDTAFLFEGCLLTHVRHLYAGNGLFASPMFFASASPGLTGIKLRALNNLGCNSNTFDRCTATNATVAAFDITGTGNVIIAADAEGITGTAAHMLIAGPATTLIGGNFEGDGAGVIVSADSCTLQGLNCLSFVNVESGVTGTTIEGGQVKFPNFKTGCANNTLRNVKITAGGTLINNGTDNEIVNVIDPNGTEIGHNRSGNFTPTIRYGSVDGPVSYFQRQGQWERIGRRVFFEIFFQVNNAGSATGDVTIDLGDIPHPAAAGTVDTVSDVTTHSVTIGTNFSSIEGRVLAGTRTIRLTKRSLPAGANSNVTSSAISQFSQIRVSGSYRVE